MDDESENYDMFQSIKPSALPAAPSNPTKMAPAITMSDSEDDVSEEEKFIANENMAANRKNKKSGGFQSMGIYSLDPTLVNHWIAELLR